MKQLLLLTIGLFLVFFSLSAQNSISAESIFSMLQDQEIINVTIETNLDSLINVRRRESYQRATFTYKNRAGEQITRKIKVKPRGKYRRRVCDFPTIKLNFSKKEFKGRWHG